MVKKMRINGTVPVIQLLAFTVLFAAYLPDVVSGEENIRPVAVIQPFPEVNLGDEVMLNGSASFDPDASENVTEEIIEWTWFVRQGYQGWSDQSLIGTGEVISHVFQGGPSYVVNLTVTDTEGLKGWVEKQVMVNGPDLTVSLLTFSDPSEEDLEAGDRPTVSIGYRNIGGATIDTPWVLKLRYDGVTVLEETIETPLAQFEQAYYNISNFFEVKTGDLTFKVILDAEFDIEENEEINNYLSRSLRVEGELDDDDVVWDDDEGRTEEAVFPATLLLLMCMILILIFVIVAVPLIIIIVILKMSKKRV
ncbi:MAG: CARDB domain-containing protein [Candidatus Thermoplasmatota archaeon]|nr:CARDB domain-containing protein [Candidatus Thermoplasmatota archaeon]